MKIIGWIRYGDKAACGGTAIEGDQTCRSHGRAYAFQGARVACRKDCIIAEGFPRSTLTNERAQVIHGMTPTYPDIKMSCLKRTRHVHGRRFVSRASSNVV